MMTGNRHGAFQSPAAVSLPLLALFALPFTSVLCDSCVIIASLHEVERAAAFTQEAR